jgi:hypothetical protein
MIEFYDYKSGGTTKTAALKDLQSLWDRVLTQFMISLDREPPGIDFLAEAGEAALGDLFKAMIDTEVTVLRLPEKLVDVSARCLRDFVGHCMLPDVKATLDEQIRAAVLYLPILDTVGLALDSVAIAYHLHGKVTKLDKTGSPTSVASVLTKEALTIVANEPDLAFDKSREIDDSVGELFKKSVERSDRELKLAEVELKTDGAFRAYSYYVKLLKDWSKGLKKPTLNAKFTFGELSGHYLKLTKTKQIHAELRLIDLFVTGALTSPPFGLIYIGSSLLCCSDCARAIDFFNNHVSHAEGLGLRVITRGAHPGCYKDSWDFPYFVAKYKDEFLEANPGFATRAANSEAAGFSRSV